MPLFKKSMLALLVAGISFGNIFSMNDGLDPILLRQMHDDCNIECAMVNTVAAAQEQADLLDLQNWEASNPADFTFQIPGVLTYAKHYATVAARNIQTQATNFWSKLPSFNTVAQSVKDVGSFAKAKAVEKPYVAAAIVTGTIAALCASRLAWKKFCSKPQAQLVAQDRAPRFRVTNLD